MKLPFTFAAPLIFRLVFPGLILTAALLPALKFVWAQIGPPVELTVVLPFFVVFLGWLITILDQPIYMAFEGRRYWPPCLWDQFYKSECNRLDGLNRKRDKAIQDHDRLTETEVDLQTTAFPLDENGERKVNYPTRLGNLMTEYEEYPDVKYGVDGVFYWYRIWFNLDKDVKKELDELQAFVDGMLYVAAILYLAACISFLYAMLELFVGLTLMPPISWKLYLPMTPVLAIIGYVLYRLSLPAQGQYGAFFKAMFDCHYAAFDPKPVLKIIADATGHQTIALKEGPDAYRIAWRYLHWHVFRPPNSTTNENFDKVRIRPRP